jgi:IS4 transposase
LEILENDQCSLGAKESVVGIRVINFCDLDKKTEYRLATNLPSLGEQGITNEEIGEIYRKRWGIELLWKFLKMHLKLDRIITKNQNGIEIQIYTSLIAYLLLNMMKIPKEMGHKLLDKFRYLQAVMCEQINYIYWFEKLIFTG